MSYQEVPCSTHEEYFPGEKIPILKRSRAVKMPTCIECKKMRKREYDDRASILLDPSEKETQISILDYLAKRQIFHYRNNTGAMKIDNRFVRFGSSGSPDIIAVIEGHYVGIEVKSEKGEQSDDQKAFQASLLHAGGIYFLVRSIDGAMEAIEDAITRLRLKGRGNYKCR